MKHQSTIGNMSDQPGHWVQELFPPAFAFTVDDVLAGKPEDVALESKIKHVAAFDPEAIRQVYEKVRLMTILDEEMKSQRSQREKDGKIAKTSTETESLVSLEEKEESVDLEDSCIWDAEELSVLRKVFRAARGQIQALEVRLRETERWNKVLEEEISEKTKLLENKSTDFSEARKANQRLKIQCDSLQGQLDHSSAKLDAVTEMWKEISEEKTAMQKETQELRVAFDKERLARERLELQLQGAEKKIAREKYLAQENARMKYEKEIMDLQLKVKSLSEGLLKEKMTHCTTNKALGSLRQHFASLPLKHIIPPSAVTEDQVTDVDYLSIS